jgi:anti-repressor protein
MSALDLVERTEDGTLATTSLIIADGTGNDHASVLRLIRNNLTDFEDFGRVGFENRPFETAGGTQNRKVAVLNREHAMFAMTLFRNNDIVVDFKKRLIHAFVALEHRANAPALTGKALLAQAVLEAQDTITELEEENRALAPRADVADKFLTADTDYSVADAAKVLTRAGVKTGERRLFAALADLGWIYRNKGDGKWRVKQTALDAKYMSVLPSSHYHPKTGVLVLDPPQPRVTFKGIARVGVKYGVVIEPDPQLALID